MIQPFFPMRSFAKPLIRRGPRYSTSCFTHHLLSDNIAACPAFSFYLSLGSPCCFLMDLTTMVMSMGVLALNLTALDIIVSGGGQWRSSWRLANEYPPHLPLIPWSGEVCHHARLQGCPRPWDRSILNITWIWQWLVYLPCPRTWWVWTQLRGSQQTPTHMLYAIVISKQAKSPIFPRWVDKVEKSIWLNPWCHG